MPWDLTGNNGTNPATDFLGTTDDQPLVIRTNGAEALRIHGSGSVGIGTTIPNAGLHVSGTGGKGTIRIEREGKSLSLNPNWAGRNEFARITTVQGSNMGLQLDTNEVPKLTITVGGDVGIGTTNPQERLEVNGNILVRGDVRIADSRGRQVFNFDSFYALLDLGATGNEGDLRIRGDDGQVKIHLDGHEGDIRLLGADCAEDFDVSDAEAAEPGTVMVIDQEGALTPSEQPYDKRVAGVISGAEGFKSGIIFDKQQSEAERMPVALMGKVGCKVDAQYSPIEVGDLLTTSPTPGHAMKAVDHSRAFGATIGKALRPLRAGNGIIPTLIALQ
jgi:hypothetical protein